MKIWTILIELLLLATSQLASGYLLISDEAELQPLTCYVDASETLEKLDLDDDCAILKLYNQTHVDELAYENKLEEIITHCACELMQMKDLWRRSFDLPETLRVFNIVTNSIQKADSLRDQGNPQGALTNYPPYLWSDIDVTVYGISIHTATKDYFDKYMNPIWGNKFKLNRILRRQFEKIEQWNLIKKVCWQVSDDPHKLYRYMENLIRASPMDFSRMVNQADHIDLIYQASKACKILLLLRLRDYKLRPSNAMFVAVDETIQKSIDDDTTNSVNTNNYNDLDTMLRDSSAALLNCKPWQREKLSLDELKVKCPMMMAGDDRQKLPVDWLANYTSSYDKSVEAINCACQLLLHHSVWEAMMRDENVELMSKAITNYMNENQVPNFAESSILTMRGWFDKILKTFELNRKMTIKEIIKTKYRENDPTIYMRKNQEDDSLELLRRGCNYIMFNYNKGSKDAARGEFKLIKYLDNLQIISRDPMFVFHLVLQDANLFKLYALSKVCKPIVY